MLFTRGRSGLRVNVVDIRSVVGTFGREDSTVSILVFLALVMLLLCPFTLRFAVLETVPYLLLAVQVKVPESSGKTSAITKVHISSDSAMDLGFF